MCAHPQRGDAAVASDGEMRFLLISEGPAGTVERGLGGTPLRSLKLSGEVPIAENDSGLGTDGNQTRRGVPTEKGPRTTRPFSLVSTLARAPLEDRKQAAAFRPGVVPRAGFIAHEVPGSSPDCGS